MWGWGLILTGWGRGWLWRGHNYHVFNLIFLDFKSCFVIFRAQIFRYESNGIFVLGVGFFFRQISTF